MVQVKLALVSNWVRVPIQVQGHWLDKSKSILNSTLTRFGLMVELVSRFDSWSCLCSFGVQDLIKSLFLNILPGKIQGIVYQTCTLHFMRHCQNRVQFFIGHDILISCETHLPNNLSTPAWSSSSWLSGFNSRSCCAYGFLKSFVRLYITHRLALRVVI